MAGGNVGQIRVILGTLTRGFSALRPGQGGLGQSNAGCLGLSGAYQGYVRV